MLSEFHNTKSSTMWVIANFIEEDNVEVVPHTWMQDDDCYWPTLPRDRLKKYIEKEIVPDGSQIWKTYKARVIGRPYEDLQKARQKSNIALTRSDIETDIENKKREVKRTKRFYISDDSSTSSEPEKDFEYSRNSPEKEDTPKKLRKTLWPSSKKKEGPVESPLKEHSDFPEPRRSPRKLTPASKPKAINTKNSLSRDMDFCMGLSEPCHRPTTSAGSSSNIGSSSKSETFEHISIRNQNTIKNYLRSILAEVAAINTKVDMLMGQRHSAIEGEMVEEESHFMNELPVKTMDGLLALEETLKDKTKESELVNFLARLGGSNVGDSCRRALRASLMDEVACEFSWKGQKGKRVFSSLNLKTAILRAVFKQFKEAKENEVEGVIKDWLRPSRNRLLSKEKSRKRDNADNQQPEELEQELD